MTKVISFLTALKDTGKEFSRHHCIQMAGTISFFLLLSSFPLVILTTSLIRLIIGDIPEIDKNIAEISDTLIPHLSTWIKKGIISIAKKTTITSSIVGFIILGWSSSQLLRAINYSFKIIADYSKSDKKFKRLKSRAGSIYKGGIIGVVLLGVLLLTMIPVDMFYKNLVSAGLVIDSWLTRNLIYFVLEQKIISTASVLIFLALLFKLMLPNKVDYKTSLIGSTFFTTLFVGAKYIYRFYLNNNMSSLQSIYGIFTTLFIIVLWFYYISCLFLFCSQLVVILSQKKNGNQS